MYWFLSKDVNVKLLILFFACVWSGISHSLAAERPSIILLTADTLRVDHLGCYGYPHPISPALDRLSHQSILFVDAVTCIGKTGPAFASLFTSQFPPSTGARRNSMRLRPDYTSMAEMIREKGYSTAAILSNWTLKDKLCGLKRGFDYYDNNLPKVRHFPMFRERSAERVTKVAIEWLNTNRNQPFFAWIHYSDPHSPYEFHRDFPVELTEYNARAPGDDKRRRYASEVRYMDYWIGQLLIYLSDHVNMENTLVIFTSDHGESLGEQGCWGHGKNVYQANLKIPLFIVDLERHKPILDRFPASIVDIMPTILNRLQIESEGCKMMGINLLQYPRDRSVAAPIRYAFSDRGVNLATNIAQRYKKPVSMCRISQDTKIIKNFSNDSWEYYYLDVDPNETISRIMSPPENFEALKIRLDTWYEKIPKFDGQPKNKLSDVDIDQLKSLGYIQ